MRPSFPPRDGTACWESGAMPSHPTGVYRYRVKTRLSSSDQDMGKPQIDQGHEEVEENLPKALIGYKRFQRLIRFD